AITNITYATTGATGATFSGLPAGVTGNWAAGVVTISGTPTASGTFNYTVTLTGGCGTVTANGTITVTPDNTITLTSAAGTDNQTVCVNTAITDITYSTTGATGATVTGLPAGVAGIWAADAVTISGTPSVTGIFNYTVTLTGGCGTVTATGTITVTTCCTITLISPAGTDNQSVCINTPITNITYSTTGATGATFSGLPAGVTGNWAADVVTISGTPTTSGTFNYTVTLTGSCGGETASGTITVVPDNTITLTSAAGTDNQAVCINTAITDITYTTTGATGATFTGLPAGVTGVWAADAVTISGTPSESGIFNYTVELTGGCGTVSATGVLTVNQIPVLVVTDPAPVCSPSTVDLTDPAITAGSEAGLTFTYWLDAAATTPHPLPATSGAGTFYIRGTNASGCFDIKPVTVTVNDSPNGVATVTHVTCPGGNDGAIDLTVSGGTAPYSFLWSNGATTEDVSNLTAGSYSVTITDVNGCSTIVSADVNDGAGTPITVTVNVTGILCHGESTGVVDITVTGGTAPYSFIWNNGATTEDLSGIPAGTYSVVVTDVSGCSATAEGTVSEPDSIVIGMSVTDVRCFGEANGAVDITVTGGTPNYTFLWSNGETTEDISGLSGGKYTIAVTDANGCVATAEADVAEPAQSLVATAVVTDVLCYGESTGAVDVTVTGGTAPYTFLWNNGATTEDLTGIPAGNYSVTVTDAHGCTAFTGGTVSQPATGMSASVTVTDVLCNGGNNGAVDLTVTDGTAPYTFLWNNGATTEDLTNVTAGSYSLSITDATGCTIVQNAQVTEPPALSVEATVVNATCPDTRDGSITLTITGGTPPYTALWSDGVTGITRSAGDSTYTVIVVDNNGCTATLDVEVTFTGTNCLEVYEVITPNGDGKNDVWIIRNIEMYPDAEVFVYNRWGRLIFHTKNIAANPWDGKYKGKLVPTDSYHYILYLNDGSKPRKGVITVIR
ncbi:MAG TPA: gliding motility-associated C-terminal domain-containing protein, partial [Bacteroidales bacterium]|nr:gliding motility-associated C-terminal domain-containing protein [Bacteroidales bacterium]